MSQLSFTPQLWLTIPQQLARSLFSRTLLRKICRLNSARPFIRGKWQTTLGLKEVVLDTWQGIKSALLPIGRELQQPKRRKTLNLTLAFPSILIGISYNSFRRRRLATRGRPSSRLKAVLNAKQLHGPAALLLNGLLQIRPKWMHGPFLLWNSAPPLVRHSQFVDVKKSIGSCRQLRHPQHPFSIC